VETNRAGGNQSGQAMQLKLSLRGAVKPPVWRRLLVPADIRLDRLHDVIQTSMGWTDTHLHVFSTAGRRGGAGRPATARFTRPPPARRRPCVVVRLRTAVRCVRGGAQRVNSPAV
jgi:Plasmid pRiA4b ORF-3-like protein